LGERGKKNRRETVKRIIVLSSCSLTENCLIENIHLKIHGKLSNWLVEEQILYALAGFIGPGGDRPRQGIIKINTD
jgi:hypothetical protein